jgi:hypothetical protein
MPKWEYKTVKFESTGWTSGNIDESVIDGRINKLGDQGWELVSTFDTNKTEGASKYFVMTFKRPK